MKWNGFLIRDLENIQKHDAKIKKLYDKNFNSALIHEQLKFSRDDRAELIRAAGEMKKKLENFEAEIETVKKFEFIEEQEQMPARTVGGALPSVNLRPVPSRSPDYDPFQIAINTLIERTGAKIIIEVETGKKFTPALLKDYKRKNEVYFYSSGPEPGIYRAVHKPHSMVEGPVFVSGNGVKK